MAITVNGTTATVSGLTSGTQYRFRVRARNAVGYGPYSDWSEPGTPGGGSPAPAAAISVAVSLGGYTGLQYVTGSYGSTMAFASWTSREGQIANVSVIWEGQYYRYQPAAGLNVRLITTNNAAWAPISALVVPTIGSNPNYWQFSTTTGQLLNPYSSTGQYGETLQFRNMFSTPGYGTVTTIAPNFWNIRCRITGTVVTTSGTVSAEGISRSIAFKDMWNGVDYPTDIIPVYT